MINVCSSKDAINWINTRAILESFSALPTSQIIAEKTPYKYTLEQQILILSQ